MSTFAFIIIIACLLGLALFYFRYRVQDHSQYDQPAPALIKAADQISPEHQNVVEKLKEYHANFTVSLSKSRQRMDDLLGRPVDSEVIAVKTDGVEGEWVLAEGAIPNHRLLYIHGGAFRVGSPKSHRFIASEISRLSGVAVLSIQYRMQPEFKTIHCHEDCRVAYDWVLNNGPTDKTPAQCLFVAGDSAGGNLTLALLAWARDNNKRVADGAIALAPATDASFSSPSWNTNAKTDPFLGPLFGKLAKTPWLLMQPMLNAGAGRPVKSAEISPLLGDLSNLPPTLIQVSKDEMLYDDSVRYANKAMSQNSEITLQVWPTLVHVFQGFAPDLPEANEALALIGEFIRSKTKHAG